MRWSADSAQVHRRIEVLGVSMSTAFRVFLRSGVNEKLSETWTLGRKANLGVRGVSSFSAPQYPRRQNLDNLEARSVSKISSEDLGDFPKRSPNFKSGRTERNS